MYIELNELD